MERGLEADRLAIYFEEIGAYQHKKNKELQNPSSTAGPREEVTCEFVLGDDEDEE